MGKITKPEANPVIAALLCLILNLGHLVINGQQKKWIITLIVVSVSCCFFPITLILSMLDAYKTAEKLKAGKEIDEHEYSNALLFKICKLIHKEAVLVE